MKLKLTAILGTILLLLGFTATPAQAALYGCPDRYICLYANINYNWGRWQVHPNAINGQCWNLSGSAYTTGENVNNTSGSMIINDYGFDINQGVRFYDWINCNEGGPSTTLLLDEITMYPNLSNMQSGNWYHRFTSVKVISVS